MLSLNQCELARVITKDTTSDIQINSEFDALTTMQKNSMFEIVDKLAREHSDSFDKAFPIMVNDFNDISSKFSISPSTLFCVYMDVKSKQIK